MCDRNSREFLKTVLMLTSPQISSLNSEHLCHSIACFKNSLFEAPCASGHLCANLAGFLHNFPRLTQNTCVTASHVFLKVIEALVLYTPCAQSSLILKPIEKCPNHPHIGSVAISNSNTLCVLCAFTFAVQQCLRNR